MSVRSRGWRIRHQRGAGSVILTSVIRVRVRIRIRIGIAIRTPIGGTIAISWLRFAGVAISLSLFSVGRNTRGLDANAGRGGDVVLVLNPRNFRQRIVEGLVKCSTVVGIGIVAIATTAVPVPVPILIAVRSSIPISISIYISISVFVPASASDLGGLWWGHGLVLTLTTSPGVGVGVGVGVAPTLILVLVVVARLELRDFRQSTLHLGAVGR